MESLASASPAPGNEELEEEASRSPASFRHHARYFGGTVSTTAKFRGDLTKSLARDRSTPSSPSRQRRRRTRSMEKVKARD